MRRMFRHWGHLYYEEELMTSLVKNYGAPKTLTVDQMIDWMRKHDAKVIIREV